MNNKMPSLEIGNLEVKIPIVQGGMGVGVSLSGLASAVANEGGIGVIATAGIGMLEPDFNTNYTVANQRALAKEIRKAKKLSDGVIGVNLMLALTDFDELILVAVEEGADILFLGAGLFLKNPKTISIERLRTLSTKFCPIVSSPRAAKIIFEHWDKSFGRVPDAVVVEGPLAGGHLGFKRKQIHDPDFKLEKLLKETLPIIETFENRYGRSIPVIAGGGVFTGEDIYKMLQLGAKGVQMATRFVATHECDASIQFKEAYLNCKEEDIVIIDSPVGLPGRAILNDFLYDVSIGKNKPINCRLRCLRTCDYKTAPYCIAHALTNAKKGNLKDGFGFAGANAHRLDKIISVKELIEDLKEEYRQATQDN
jgi:nitronate monooxygenase